VFRQSEQRNFYKLLVSERGIGRGEPLFIDEPKTIAELFQRSAHKFPKTNILNFKRDGDWQGISGEEMFLQMQKCSAALEAFGIQKGDRVAILAPNSPEWTITDGACQIAALSMFRYTPLFRLPRSNTFFGTPEVAFYSWKMKHRSNN
jgi:hypothetical protein